jgi:hypothetical protein
MKFQLWDHITCTVAIEFSDNFGFNSGKSTEGQRLRRTILNTPILMSTYGLSTFLFLVKIIKSSFLRYHWSLIRIEYRGVNVLINIVT